MEDNHKVNESQIIRYLAGESDEIEVKALLEWVNAAPENNEEFVRIKNSWSAAGMRNMHKSADLDEEFARLSYRLGFENTQPEKPLMNFSKWQLVFKVAAMMVLIYSLGISFLYFNRVENIKYNEVFTLRGQRTNLVLSDGTRIWLNSESKLRYPENIDGDEVNVYLEGEAYFQVSKKHGRKFIVNASDIDISVLGTSFNVKSYSAEKTIEATLEEGKISITGKIGKAKLNKPVILMPKQRIVFSKLADKENFIIETIKPPQGENSLENKTNHNRAIEISGAILQESLDTRLYTSWRNGRFEFNHERFEDLATRLERWYDIEIEIQDAEIKNWKYTGTFEKETIEQALNALSLSMAFDYEINKNRITIKTAN